MSCKSERKSRNKRKKDEHSPSQPKQPSEKYAKVEISDEEKNIGCTHANKSKRKDNHSVNFNANYNKLLHEYSDINFSIENASQTSDTNEILETDPCTSTHTNLDIVRDKLSHVSKIVTDDMCQILTEQSVKMLQKVIKEGTDYMNLCGRTKFFVDDFYRGLFICREWQFNEPYLYVQKSNVDNNYSIKHDLNFKGEWLENYGEVTQNIPVELQNYFIEVSRVLYTEENELCSVVNKDLETSSSILKLVPYFVKFLSDYVHSLLEEFELESMNSNRISNLLRISRLLQTMHSLLLNPHIHFFQDSDLCALTDTLLRILLLHLGKNVHKFIQLSHSRDFIDCWCLKDYAAYLLKQVLKKSRSNRIMTQLMDKIEPYISDCNSNFISQYGAMAAINSIGIIAILWLMPLYLDKYVKFLNDAHSSHEEHDISMLKGQLIHSHYILTHHYFKYEFYKNVKEKYFPFFLKDKVFPFLSQSNFTEYFGDALIQHFPLHFVSSSVHVKKNARSKRQICKFPLKFSNSKRTPTSREKVFNVIPLKHCTIKFGKINMKI